MTDERGGDGADDPAGDQSAALATLVAVTRRLAAADRLQPRTAEPLLHAVVATAAAVLDAQASSIALHDPATDQLVFVAAAGPASGDVVGLGIAATAGHRGLRVLDRAAAGHRGCRAGSAFRPLGGRLDRLCAQLAAGDAAHRRPGRGRRAGGPRSTRWRVVRPARSRDRGRARPGGDRHRPGRSRGTGCGRPAPDQPRGGPRGRGRRSRCRGARERDDRRPGAGTGRSGVARWPIGSRSWWRPTRTASSSRPTGSTPSSGTPAGAAAPVDRDDRAAHRLERGVRRGAPVRSRAPGPAAVRTARSGQRLRRVGRRWRPGGGHRLGRRSAADMSNQKKLTHSKNFELSKITLATDINQNFLGALANLQGTSSDPFRFSLGKQNFWAKRPTLTPFQNTGFLPNFRFP